MGNFSFLKDEWKLVFESASLAEKAVESDPRTACFYSRRTLELLVAWLYKHDKDLRLPYQENLSALIHEPTFKNLVGEAIFSKARLITRLGNHAVHSHRPIPKMDALTAIQELFHIGYWLAHNYARAGAPDPNLAFNPALLPKEQEVVKKTIDQLQSLEEQLHQKDERLSELLANKEDLDTELERLRAEVTRLREEASQRVDTHNYSEEETRDYFIDLLLKEAGWPLTEERDREFEVTGMPSQSGQGFVDYVLWGDDGKPLGLVEAKRTKRDPRVGQQQAKLYADCLEAMFGQRPVIFYTNGYKHWIWDDQMYPPREVQGFYKKDELELIIQRRTSRRSLAEAPITETIVERYYQTRAIRRISEAFEQDKDRKALIVMATGAGKTRTVIALCDLLARCNWAKRILFLADRVALVKQAGNAFKAHLPDSSPVNLIEDRDGEGRVYVSTYPTMMGLIDRTQDGQRRFGPGHFDLIVIDEAHRSVFKKYSAIFEYFDSLLVGLTATPRDEVGRNTYRLFDLENGVPTDAYELHEAVADKFLVPPKAVSVPIKFQREGIKYEDLSEEEKDQWDELDWDESGASPSAVDPGAVNNWLFNEDTVDKALAHLMTNGIKVAGGDRLGKTIIFAKNREHAEFIAERFNANYPRFMGNFSRVITYKTEYVQSIIDSFSSKDRDPHIAVSVDMLDTGVDVPEVVNLVFFKMVRSKTKFWQMVGRGTRLCKDLFGPGMHKTEFYIFDYLQNLEYFSENPDATEGSVAKSLSERLFLSRLDLIAALQDSDDDEGIRKENVDILRSEIEGMNLENFVVRPKRKFIENYSPEEKWEKISEEDYEILASQVAGLPSEMAAQGEDAKRFDLIMLKLQLAKLRNSSSFEKLKNKVRDIAHNLEGKSSIPMVNAEMELILEIQDEGWWEDVTLQMLENARKRLRELVKFIEKSERRIVFTDFEDEVGEEYIVELPNITGGVASPVTPYGEAGNLEKFRLKARAFLKDQTNHIAIQKLRMNQALTKQDTAELERMFKDSSIGTDEIIQRIKDESEGFGVFVRSLVGLDREAAKQAFAGFIAGQNLAANQIEFVNMVIDHLTEHGVMDAALLYESPFTDINPQGPEGIFSAEQVGQLISLLENVRDTAIGA